MNGALQADRRLADAGQTMGELLARHRAGDWGQVDSGDAAVNDAALADGGRILSAYTLRGDIKVWVITWARTTAAGGRRPS